MLTVDELAQMIDHSILLPSQTEQDLVEGVAIARQYKVRCVSPKPYQTARSKELLRGSEVRLCVPIGFPHGVTLPEVKRFEAEQALHHGAQELDMVINVSALKSGQYDYTERDISRVVEIARRHGAPVKAILNTHLLTEEEKVAACHVAERAGASFVQTSACSQAAGGAVEDVRLLRATCPTTMTVKASGGITDIDELLALYDAGARRFGTDHTVDILEGLRKKLEAAGGSR